MLVNKIILAFLLIAFYYNEMLMGTNVKQNKTKKTNQMNTAAVLSQFQGF